MVLAIEDGTFQGQDTVKWLYRISIRVCITKFI